MPSFWRPAYAELFGCAPRKSSGVMLPALGTPGIVMEVARSPIGAICAGVDAAALSANAATNAAVSNRNLNCKRMLAETLALTPLDVPDEKRDAMNRIFIA